MEQTVFEIISVGNELLIGRVENTNVHWLVTQITKMGGFVRRAITIRDDLSEISMVLRDSISRQTDWIIMSGGLGPTYDDMTLQGVARALERGMEVNEDAVSVMKQRYESLVAEGVLSDYTMTPARVKMATLPKGSIPLKNSQGSAPGVLVKEGKSSIVCLPGVPKEMKAIFEESLLPFLEKSIVRLYSYSVTLFVSGIVESVLSPLLDEVLKSNPGVYVKSHPKGVENGVSKIEIHIMCSAVDAEEAKKLAVKVSRMLSSLIGEAKGVVDRVEEAVGQG
ncbi:MAG: hypothetical protein HY619_03080 [Thaumarchaeota archaeon]|nr:hypothetical protein [Nitrososphaerota archaeon]